MTRLAIACKLEALVGKKIFLVRFPLSLLAAALLTSGCEGEPTYTCERTRVVWPDMAYDPSTDVSTEAGLQVDLPLRSNLNPQLPVQLTIIPEEGDSLVHDELATTNDDGSFTFHDVFLPPGRVRLAVAAEGLCGEQSAGRRIFVWDTSGRPQCELSLRGVPSQTTPTVWQFGAEQDEDSEASGVQTVVEVLAGRPDVEVEIFWTAQDDVVAPPTEEVTPDANGVAQSLVSLPDGDLQLRAICRWPDEDLLLTSPTIRVHVDTSPDVF